MDKLKQLFIRACKSNDPHKRLTSIYRRFYLMAVPDPKPYISAILLGIVEEHNLMTVRELAYALSPYRFTGLLRNKDIIYEDLLLSVLVSKIRLTAVKDFPGLTIPRKVLNVAYEI